MITCEQHDYIEIVCTFHYPLKLLLQSGDEIECVALDTASDINKNECVKVKYQDKEMLVILDDIVKLEVLVKNPHFQTAIFKR
jgi:Rho-binding antiterminator